MKPACELMRPKLPVLIALLSMPLNFAVFVRFRISNRISPVCEPLKAKALLNWTSMFLRI